MKLSGPVTGGVVPDRYAGQFGEVGREIEGEAVAGAVQSPALHAQDEEYAKGERGREVDDFAGALDAFACDEVEGEPGEAEREHQLPNETARVLDRFRCLENIVASK